MYYVSFKFLIRPLIPAQPVILPQVGTICFGVFASFGHIGKPMAILIDGEVVAAPIVMEPIAAEASINGHFTREEAEKIVAGMKAQ
jgi:preprotein translocase subunit SecD